MGPKIAKDITFYCYMSPFAPILEQAEPVWIFDYDLTLYPHSQKQVLHGLDENINLFIVDKLGVSLEKAGELRLKYWESHGTTLAGLQEYEGVEPNEYFDFIQSGPRIIDPIPVPELKELLENLHGTKLVFTNGRSDWAHRGIRAMGLEKIFDEVYGLEHYGWLGKPQLEPYLHIESHWKKGSHLCFFDDKIENLKVAHERGWTTCWVHPRGDSGEWPLALKELKDLARWFQK